MFLPFLLQQRNISVACDFNNSIGKLLFQEELHYLKAINVSPVYHSDLWSCSQNLWETLNSSTKLAFDSLGFTMIEPFMKPNIEIKHRWILYHWGQKKITTPQNWMQVTMQYVKPDKNTAVITLKSSPILMSQRVYFWQVVIQIVHSPTPYKSLKKKGKILSLKVDSILLVWLPD